MKRDYRGRSAAWAFSGTQRLRAERCQAEDLYEIVPWVGSIERCCGARVVRAACRRQRGWVVQRRPVVCGRPTTRDAMVLSRGHKRISGAYHFTSQSVGSFRAYVNTAYQSGEYMKIHFPFMLTVRQARECICCLCISMRSQSSASYVCRLASLQIFPVFLCNISGSANKLFSKH